MTDRTFAEAAAQALHERGISLRAAARAMNYDPAYLSRTLTGKQLPSAQLAKSIDRLVGAEGKLVALAAATNEESVARVARSMKNPSRIDAGTVKVFTDCLWAQRKLEDVIGPRSVLPAMRGQIGTIRELARNARGKHRDAFLATAAEWMQYTGWLHAAVRRDERAIDLLSRAEEIADEAGDPVTAAIAVSFKGYVARQQGRSRGVVRNAMAALHTPGSHPAQRCFDLLQAAQGHSSMNEKKEALGLLEDATTLIQKEIEPPRSLYWYKPPFFQMNIGMVYWELGENQMAADFLSSGLGDLPEDQQGAEWTHEYREVLSHAERGR
ncbi:helix-turn-helix domain-containing protein [Streptomyces rapamycinicus]|uniref:XRE family transcriptional regulator n=2 Tax=Streptomyces rapamycinicus TaxID=1226757 RepID=A0A3L8RQY4_STRRN|nr:helix-turn-helix transcriptional regulator [Streptomyces rapamycinicus]MBB4782830.1 transcriptional regulator with XRE-family HTH domain [Streptomyces rapamycinicus]RLV81690.1 XRE family transcriptional regulator [Streptomyces rapamycinicus NRRL 5491]UTO63299.1 helix-turn-helix transcriptional regulator [Streptomyces rapamycinicus]UTP31257.1 helix-turn-helix transcriptional regulator [Streptomyces rapamycinicus NRRL 5491]